MVGTSTQLESIAAHANSLGTSFEQIEPLKQHIQVKISELSAKIDGVAKAENIDPAALNTAIQEALKAHPGFSEPHEFTHNGITLILIRDHAGTPEILIKGQQLGRGAAGDVFKVVSINTGQTHAAKLAGAMADDASIQNEIDNLAKLNQGKESIVGMQGRVYRFGNVIVSPLYKHTDLGKQTEIVRFAREVLHIPENEINKASLTSGIDELVNNFSKSISKQPPPSDEERKQLVADFYAKAGVCYQHFHGLEESLKLQDDITVLKEKFDQTTLDAVKMKMTNLAVKMSERYVPRDMNTKLTQAAQLYSGFLHLLKSGIFHGDIKPGNFFWDDNQAVVADFDGAVTKQKFIARMNKDFTISSADEAFFLRAAVPFLQANNEAKLQTLSQPVLKKLHEMGFVELDEVVEGGQKKVKFKELVPDQGERLDALQKHLRVVLFPAGTKGYALESYSRKMEDFFWQNDEKNFSRACDAFEMHAFGVALFEHFCAGQIPLSPEQIKDPEFYNGMAKALEATGLDKRICELIMKMVRPIDLKGDPIPLPINEIEMNSLQALLVNHSK